MSREDIDKLYSLSESDFSRGEYIILKYAREYTLAGGKCPGTEASVLFNEEIDAKLRKAVRKIIHMMLLANYFTNTFSDRVWKEDNAVCNLPLKSEKQD